MLCMLTFFDMDGAFFFFSSLVRAWLAACVVSVLRPPFVLLRLLFKTLLGEPIKFGNYGVAAPPATTKH